MDALSLIIRPQPQTPPPSSGPAAAAKPSTSSSKPDDAPAFAPAEQASQPATEQEKPSAKKDDKPTQTTGETASKSTPSQDQSTSAEQIAATAANADAAANTLLIAQAAASQTTTVATPMAAPIVVALPPQPSTAAAKKPDATTAITTVANKPAQPAAPTTATSAAAPRISTAAQPTAQPDGAQVSQSPTPGLTTASTPPSSSQQQDAGDGATASPGKPNALNALLDSAKPQTTQASAPQPQAEAAAQPLAPQPAPPTQQVAQPASAKMEEKPVAAELKTETKALAPLQGPGDAPTAATVSFGTDPGASAHVKTATAAYETARASTPILPASEQVAMQIHRAIEDGVDKLTVELKPASLGRVSAEIQFHDDQRVHVVLSADRPATLDALRSDSRALERALQDAGLRADAGSLSFRFENGGGQPNFKPNGSGDGMAISTASSMRDTDTAPLTLTAYASFTRPGGVDIRV